MTFALMLTGAIALMTVRDLTQRPGDRRTAADSESQAVGIKPTSDVSELSALALTEIRLSAPDPDQALTRNPVQRLLIGTKYMPLPGG